MDSDESTVLIPPNASKSEPSKFYLVSSLLRYATRLEKLMLIVGILASILCAFSIPLLSIVIGDIGRNFIDLTKDLHNQTIAPEELDKELQIFGILMHRNCLGYAVLGMWSTFFAFVQTSFLVYVGENIIYRLRRDFIAELLKQDAEWFDRTSIGTISTYLNDNLERIREGTGDKIGLTIQFFTEFTISFAISFVYSWKMAVSLIAVAPIMMATGVLNTWLSSKFSKKQNALYAEAGNIASQALGSIKTVIALNGQNQEITKYESVLKKARMEGYRKALSGALSRGASFIILCGLQGAAFFIGSYYVYDGVLDGGTVMIVFYSLLFGCFAFSEAWPQLSSIGSAIGAASPIFDIINNTHETIENSANRYSQDIELVASVEFNNVSFAYPTRCDTTVLKGVSFKAEEGETIALVGASGSGKSTIVQLLLQFYEQSAGTIKIGGHDVSNLDLKFLRKFAGVVSQEPILFNATIEENIKFGKPQATETEVIATLRKANAYDFVMQFPKGLKTMVGERGTQLSGGQKQRLAIARTLLRNPRILLLDEATSALDAESEAIVQRALENASQGRTTLIIAHRLSTIRNANRILVMKNGEIVEMGSHSDLLAAEGIYSELVHSQLMNDFDEEDIGPLSPSRLSRSLSSEQQFDFHRQTSHQSASAPQSEQKNDMDRMKEELREEGAQRATLWQILKMCKSDVFLITLATLSSIIQAVHYPFISLLFANIVESFSLEKEEMLSHVQFWALMFVAIGIAKAFTVWVQYISLGYTAERLSLRLRLNCFKSLLHAKCSFFDDPHNSPTRLATRLSTDSSNIKLAVDPRLGGVLTLVISAFIGISLSYYYGWKLATLTLAMAPILLYAEHCFAGYVSGAARTDSKALENSNKIAAEALENVKTVRSLHMESQLLGIIDTHLQDARGEIKRKSFIQGLAFGFAGSLFFYFYSICFFYGVYLILHREMEPVNVYRALFSISFVVNNSTSATAYFPDYIKAAYAGNKHIRDGAVEVNDVSFHYEQRPNQVILDGVSLTLEPGKTIAFYECTTGNVKIDSIDVKNTNLYHLRENLSLVSQEPTLFNGSIHENLIYGLNRVVESSEINEALKTANAFDFVNSLPLKLNTLVGDRGTQLSGGQKQRIAIARAVLRNPKVLLLDEATSALDADSEKLVQKALDTASERLSTVVVAHRLSTIVNADKIVVIKAGKIVESGTHGELMKLKKSYWRLTQKQNSSGSNNQ
ncbi:unnamed protein product [Caenorhabditis auriculariae]|uniref:Uncharacterized protein n=1 Tax=Caenorhabditis auriculariae TaxID=2777116 RepID=A0A8S1GPC6_9PELO|nr:unnamed protein product [Caenorhabditis auriculariae]